MYTIILLDYAIKKDEVDIPVSIFESYLLRKVFFLVRPWKIPGYVPYKNKICITVRTPRETVAVYKQSCPKRTCEVLILCSAGPL